MVTISSGIYAPITGLSGRARGEGALLEGLDLCLLCTMFGCSEGVSMCEGVVRGDGNFGQPRSWCYG
jgi:hypothetical protein